MQFNKDHTRLRLCLAAARAAFAQRQTTETKASLFPVMSDNFPLISVVVPAFNAARTIAETLESVTAQTYRHLEIIVVDDGSTDDTASIVCASAERDLRIRLIRKENGGVASARNAGTDASSGEFVAFIDADDLWHPTKIRKQLSVILAGGADMGLVYAPYRWIDGEGQVVSSSSNYGAEGWVPFRHFYVNIVGNGSSILVRKSVLYQVGGFSSWLRDADAEGCEDLLLQLRIARFYRFGRVPEYLVGYRRLPGNMSSNEARMARSGALAIKSAFAEYDGLPGLSMRHMMNRYKWLHLKAAIKDRRIRECISFCALQFWKDPAFLLTLVARSLLSAMTQARRYLDKQAKPSRPFLAPLAPARRHFYSFMPDEEIQRPSDAFTQRSLVKLAQFDAKYRPPAAYFPNVTSRNFSTDQLTALSRVPFSQACHIRPSRATPREDGR